MARFRFQLESVFKLKKQLVRQADIQCLRIRMEIDRQQALRDALNQTIESESKVVRPTVLAERTRWLESVRSRFELFDKEIEALRLQHQQAVEVKRSLQVETEALATLRSQQFKQYRKTIERTRQLELNETILRKQD